MNSAQRPGGVSAARAMVGALLVALSLPSVGAGPERWRVVHVVDGDTLDLLIAEKRTRVRLADIDAPESGQPYGHRARQSLIQVCGGELAQIERRGKDRNRQIIARVTCNGTDAGEEQVRRGMAWVVERHAAPDSSLNALQAEARAARRGLWSEAQSIAPWEWKASGAQLRSR